MYWIRLYELYAYILETMDWEKLTSHLPKKYYMKILYPGYCRYFDTADRRYFY